MPGFEDIAKKAFYMGVGFASYAQEKANSNLQDWKVQAQNLADEMVERGKMNAEEARRFVDDLVEQAQQEAVTSNPNRSQARTPRKIEIVDEDEQPQTPSKPESNTEPDAVKKPNSNNEDLRQQVASLKEELRRLKREM